MRRCADTKNESCLKEGFPLEFWPRSSTGSLPFGQRFACGHRQGRHWKRLDLFSDQIGGNHLLLGIGERCHQRHKADVELRKDGFRGHVKSFV